MSSGLLPSEARNGLAESPPQEAPEHVIEVEQAAHHMGLPGRLPWYQPDSAGRNFERLKLLGGIDVQNY